jgi:hypothetical protein
MSFFLLNDVFIGFKVKDGPETYSFWNASSTSTIPYLPKVKGKDLEAIS